MRFFSVALVLSAIPAAVLAKTIQVQVGPGGQLKFVPETIQAAVGDQVQFMFNPKNHSVTQSTFDSPCTRAMTNGSPGVSSGFLAQKKAAAKGKQPTWTITVKNTKPLWFYCAQKKPAVHCQKGMAFSINPTPAKTHAAFIANALASNSTTPPPSDTPPSAAGNGTAPASGDAGGAPGAASDAAATATGAASGVAATGTDGAAAATGTEAVAAAAPTDSSGGATASPTDSVAAAATSASSTGTSAASNSRPKSSASKVAFGRGAASLLMVGVASVVLL